MNQGTNKYLVVTGICCFRVDALTPFQAVEALKERIHNRGRLPQHLTDPDIGMSLVEALHEGRLNFIVMDEERTLLLGGEYKGNYEDQVSRRLADSLRDMLSENLYYQTDYRTA
ncbi:MAG: hypothetical protein IT342_17090 [Candidatus Melainabacteria bacterium]|nr:hypothetical protein [Candidatus Melainabacteria bacterium]